MMSPGKTFSQRRRLLGAPSHTLLTLGVLAAVSFPALESAASYPMHFPSRGDALDSGAYFRSRGHTAQYYGNEGWAVDFQAAKWDGTHWQADDGGGQNTDDYIFGAPLYSPISGEIVACWRTAPEKPAPGVNYDLDGDGVFGEANNCVNSGTVCDKDLGNADCPAGDVCGTGHDASPLGAGNNLQIRSSTGDYIVLLAHMQNGSIPPELCPLPPDRDQDDTTSTPGQTLSGPDGWPDDRSDHCSMLPADEYEGFAQGTILPTPVPVKAGDFLGRVGHSGRSTNPHLHMHAKPLHLDDDDDMCLGISEEIVFYESWSQMCDVGQPLSGGWAPLDGDNPLQAWDIIGGSCDDDSDCDVGEICSDEECVISKPTFCFLPDAMGIQEDQDALGIPATNLKFTTHIEGDLLVYQSSGQLRLRSYDISTENGQVTTQDTHDEGAVLDVAVTRPHSSTRNVIVSIRGSNGNLKHIPYGVSSVTGAITRMVGKEWTDGTVHQVESTPSPAHGGVVVAIEDDSGNGSGNLKVIDYHVNGFLDIDRDYSSTGSGGAIDDIAITTTSDFEGVVTAEITSGGYLTLRSFEVPAAGGVYDADIHPAFVAADSVTIDRVITLLGTEVIVTSVVQSDETLRLDSWSVDASGTIDWIDSATAGVVSLHDGSAGSSMNGDFLMALRDSQDNFRMIGWGVNAAGNFRRTATRALGPVTDAAIVASAAGDGDHFVVARTDASGDLHLFSYAENFHPWF